MNTHKTLKLIYGKKLLQTNGLVFINENDFLKAPINIKTIHKAATEKKRIEKLQINGKSIPELFSYDKVSFWWCFDYTFFKKFHTTITFIINFLEYVDEKNPSSITIVNEFGMLDIIKQICQKKQIDLQISQLNYFKFQLISYIKKHIRKFVREHRLKKTTKNRIKNRNKQFFEKFNSIPNMDKKIVFASPMNYRRSIYNLEKDEAEKGEFLVKDIINLLNDKKDIVGISINFTIPGHTDTVLSERLESEILWFPEEILLLENHKSTMHRIFLKKYHKIITSKEFQKIFSFNEIFLWSHLEDVFYQMEYEPYLPYWLNMMDSLSVYFSKNKPKTILLPSEIDPIAIVFLASTNNHKIKTIGIQQGIMTDLTSYFLRDTYATEEKPYGFPLPTKLLLYGEFYKQILLKQNYPEDKLIIFGNPVYFELEKIKAILACKPLFQKYNINQNQNIILFTTGTFQEEYGWKGKYSYDILIWRKLIEHFSDKNDYYVILKPHPGENITIYEKILNEFKPSNIRIIQGNLLELLYISSIVISNFSTVIIDALTMKKPVIELKWDEPIDLILKFDEEGVVVPSKLEDLVKNIDKTLNDNKIRESLQKNGIKFLKDQYGIPVDISKTREILQKYID